MNNVTSLLSELTIAFRTRHEKLLSELNVYPGQSQVLSVLWNQDGISQSEIARSLEITSATVNLLVSKLEANKFVKCKQCSKDKRIVRVFLTSKGKEIRPKIENQWNKLEDFIFKNFSDTEKVLGLMVLEKIKKNLQTDFSEG